MAHGFGGEFAKIVGPAALSSPPQLDIGLSPLTVNAASPTHFVSDLGPSLRCLAFQVCPADGRLRRGRQ